MNREEGAPAAWGTRRRLQALASRGWSAEAIELSTDIAAADITAAMTAVIPRNRRAAAGASTALDNRVAAAYDLLWHRPPPAATPRDRELAAAARAEAERRGWAPPMAWDHEQLDRLDGQPEPGWKPTRRNSRLATDLVEDLAWVREHGGYRDEPKAVLAARLGVTPAALDQARLRAARYGARQAEAEAD